MKNLSALALCLGCILAASPGHAGDLKQSKVTQVVNDVQIISAASQSKKAATVNDAFNMPDILRTGAASRAELVAPDETVTRIGANTIFSFDPANRTIDLKQGSLLFHSPHGKGGGTIHTGSATASVLGSTLIVTTTANGGFKVLALEDQAEIKFLNGLKQKLEPGQMTFVLPGGNQISPIIVFRLDDLTKNSQLVNGFDDPLASMPLIQKQIQEQLDAIAAGKYTDTGLTVGSDANAYQVQVIDLETLQTALDQSYKYPFGFWAALRSDATINQPSLTSPLLPTPPNHIFTAQPFLLPGNTFYTGQPFKGFVARNIYINTIDADPLTVDLSPYAAMPEFDMVAAKNLNLAGSVNFDGFSPNTSLIFSLVAGNQINVAPGASIQANVANFDWQTPANFTLDSANIFNSSGNTSFRVGSGFTLQNNTYIQNYANLGVQSIGNISINSGSTINANSTTLNSTKGSLTVDGSAITVNAFGSFNAAKTITLHNSSLLANPDSGLLGFTSSAGSVNVTGTSIQAHYLSLNSGDGILLDGSGQSFTSSGSDSLANFAAKNTISVNNANLSQFGTVNMTANTINLFNVAFGNGLVNLKSLLGQWNNGTSLPGYVNNLGGVTYNGQTVNAANGFSGTIAGTGITISAK